MRVHVLVEGASERVFIEQWAPRVKEMLFARFGDPREATTGDDENR